jgi:putative tryptophan/tyrosine transport system substrate-binding protein
LRPGGNLTGINFFANELVAKRLELLRELKPAAARVAVLVNAGTAVAEPQVRDAEAAARVMGLQIHILNAGTIREIEAVFANLARERPDALLVTLDPYLPPGACNWCNWPHATPFPRSMRRAIMPS